MKGFNLSRWALAHPQFVLFLMVPFVKKAMSPPSKLRKIYWIAPPVSGRVSGEVQEFVFAQTQKGIGGVTDVIDSRKLISYPYKHM